MVPKGKILQKVTNHTSIVVSLNRETRNTYLTYKTYNTLKIMATLTINKEKYTINEYLDLKIRSFF